MTHFKSILESIYPIKVYIFLIRLLEPEPLLLEPYNISNNKWTRAKLLLTISCVNIFMSSMQMKLSYLAITSQQLILKLSSTRLMDQIEIINHLRELY